MPPSLRPAIFLDRDGVIIENRENYVTSLAAVRFIPGALEALARLAQAEAFVVIATNQSPVGRGLMTREAAEAVNAFVVDAIRAAGGRIDALYMCPHRPDENCPCRKPRPGMLRDAARDLPIDLAASVMIGDAVSDVQAGLAAGAQPVFVMSGRETMQGLQAAGLGSTPIVADLAAALAFLAPRIKTPPA